MCADLLSAARICVEGYAVYIQEEFQKTGEVYAHFLGSIARVLLALFSLLLAPPVERAGVFSPRRTAKHSLEVTQLPLPRSQASPCRLYQRNEVSK